MRVSKRAMASLLITAVMAAPGGAFAATEPAPAPVDLPAATSPAVPPVDERQAEPGGLLVTPKLSREQAIEIGTRLFKVPASLGRPSVGLSQGTDLALWSIAWTTPSDEPEQVNINVSVDAVTGTVVGYHAYKGGTEQPLQLSLTRAEAKAKADAWFEQLVPSAARATMKAVDAPFRADYWGGHAYQFNWERQIQGHPLSGDGVSITIDASTGELTQYNLSRRPSAANLQLPEKVFTQEEAEAAYAKQVALKLEYQLFSKPGTEESEWRLVYRPARGFPSMNQEGILVDGRGEPLGEQGKTLPVPAATTPYQRPAQPLTPEQALAVAKAISGRKDAPTGTEYNESGEETRRTYYAFSWLDEATETTPRADTRVVINAETGLVTEYSSWSDTEPFAQDETPAVSLEAAQQKAIQFIRSHRPDLAGSVELVVEEPWWLTRKSTYRPTDYSLNFRELKNGIPVAHDSISVTVNARTGAIEYFWMYPGNEGADKPLPSAADAISADAAMKAFLETPGLQSAWVTFWNEEKMGQTEPELMWQPVPHLGVQAIDAKTGAPLDGQGRDLIEAQRYPSDIKGHAAEREIELLWSRGVLDLQDGKFNPGEPVKAEDLVRWVVLARGLRPYPAYDFSMVRGAGAAVAQEAAKNVNSAYFGAALRSGIITGDDLALLKDLTGPVSRELASLWAVRAMGYGRIAGMEAKIEMAFADKAQIGTPYQNAVAILSGLGIASADAAGKFGPQQALTRGDAAKFLFAVTAQ